MIQRLDRVLEDSHTRSRRLHKAPELWGNGKTEEGLDLSIGSYTGEGEVKKEREPISKCLIPNSSLDSPSSPATEGQGARERAGG